MTAPTEAEPVIFPGQLDVWDALAELDDDTTASDPTALED